MNLGAGHVPDVRVALADECHVPRRPRDRRDPHLFQGPSIKMIEGPFSMFSIILPILERTLKIERHIWLWV